MKRTSILAVSLLAFMAPPAFASQTACVFSAGDSPSHYEIEFIGHYDTDPVIVFSSTVFGAGKRFTLQPANYTLKAFSQQAKAVDLEFHDPKDSATPPSFKLIGTDGRATLTIGSTVIDGELRCDF